MSIQGNINQIISMAGVISRLSPEHAEKVAEKAAQREDAKRADTYGQQMTNLQMQRKTFEKSDKESAQAKVAGVDKAIGNLSNDYAAYLMSRGNYESAAQVYSDQGIRDYQNQKVADQIEMKRQQKENYMKGRTMLNDLESWTKERGM